MAKELSKQEKAKRTRQYNKLMDALNLIDEQAEECGLYGKDLIARGNAYNKLSDFIFKTLKG